MLRGLSLRSSCLLQLRPTTKKAVGTSWHPEDCNLWREEQCHVFLQDVHCRVQFDWCAFGGKTNVPPPSSHLPQHSRGSGGLVRSKTLNTNIHVAQISRHQVHSRTSLFSFVCIVLMGHSCRLFSLLLTDFPGVSFVTCCLTFSCCHWIIITGRLSVQDSIGASSLQFSSSPTSSFLLLYRSCASQCFLMLHTKFPKRVVGLPVPFPISRKLVTGVGPKQRTLSCAQQRR